MELARWDPDSPVQLVDFSHATQQPCFVSVSAWVLLELSQEEPPRGEEKVLMAPDRPGGQDPHRFAADDAGAQASPNGPLK